MKMKNSDLQVNDRRSTGQRRRTALALPLITLLAFAFAAEPVKAQKNQPAVEAGSSVTTSVVIPVEGMSCSACVARVKRGLKAVKGVSEVQVSLEKREAEVRYAPKKTSPEKLAKAIKDLGYKAGTPKPKEKAP